MGLFLTGLMVGRTPEFVGKKIGASEIRLIMIYTLIGPVAVLLLTALAVVNPAGLAGLSTNSGPHGLSEILFAYSSNFTNHGQAFVGLSSNSLFYNVTTVVAMLLGRFGLVLPALALAGRFALQPQRVDTPGTLPTDSLLLASVNVGTIIIVGALTYFAVVALGPIIEHVLLFS